MVVVDSVVGDTLSIDRFVIEGHMTHMECAHNGRTDPIKQVDYQHHPWVRDGWVRA